MTHITITWSNGTTRTFRRVTRYGVTDDERLWMEFTQLEGESIPFRTYVPLSNVHSYSVQEELT